MTQPTVTVDPTASPALTTGAERVQFVQPAPPTAPNPWWSPLPPPAVSPVPPSLTTSPSDGERYAWATSGGTLQFIEALPVIPRQAEVVLAELLKFVDRRQEVLLGLAAPGEAASVETYDGGIRVTVPRDGDFAETVTALYELLGTVRGRRAE